MPFYTKHLRYLAYEWLFNVNASIFTPHRLSGAVYSLPYTLMAVCCCTLVQGSVFISMSTAYRHMQKMENRFMFTMVYHILKFSSAQDFMSVKVRMLHLGCPGWGETLAWSIDHLQGPLKCSLKHMLTVTWHAPLSVILLFLQHLNFPGNFLLFILQCFQNLGMANCVIF